jgi:polynucleotide 5'-hydroxyl-kinase GRC3/NOL9
MFDDENIIIPNEWSQIGIHQLEGVIMVLGGPDVGKSTFSRYIFRELDKHGEKVAYLDGDPGQSSFGTPTTLTLINNKDQFKRRFVGWISPQGHMLQMLTGIKRLASHAFINGAKTIIYDTCGLIDPKQGGVILKLSEIDLLLPNSIIAFQRNYELEPILSPVRKSELVNLIDLNVPETVENRSIQQRQEYRALRYKEYFSKGIELEVKWTDYAVYPSASFALNRLLALEDKHGFVIGLGVVTAVNRIERKIFISTPLKNMDDVISLHLGNLILDQKTFRDRRI